MSLEGYKPLDLSSLNIDPSLLKLHAPISTPSIANQILANTSWDLPAAESLGANGRPKHKKSFVSRLVDALSIGNYAVSDMALSALKAHQSSNNDSVIEDILKSTALAPVGFDKGIVASLKGTFGNTETANDPTDKNHIGDVILQATPEGRKALDPNSDMPISERKKVLLTSYLSGLPADIMTDPLNLVGVGEIRSLGKLFKGGERAEQVLKATEDAQQTKKMAELFNKAPELTNKSTELPRLNKLPPNLATALNTFDPETFDFVTDTAKLPSLLDNVTESAAKTRGSLTPPVKFPKAMGKLADPKRRKNIASVMLRDAVTNGNWKLVRQKLNSSFPGLNLAQTNRYLDQLEANPTFLEGLRRVPKNRVAFVNAIDRVLEHDFKSTGRAASEAVKPPTNTSKISDILDAIARNRGTSEVPRIAEETTQAPKLNAAEFQLAAEVMQKFKNQIETGIFPGARNVDHLKQAIESGKTVKWTGPKQVNMWQTILNRLPYSGTHKYANALKILKSVEEMFIKNGHQPFSASRAAESVPLRLSDVIEKIGIENFAKHPDHATTLLRSALAGGQMTSMAKKAASEAPELKALIDEAVGRGSSESWMLRSIIDSIPEGRLQGKITEQITKFYKDAVKHGNGDRLLKFLMHIDPKELEKFHGSLENSAIAHAMHSIARGLDPFVDSSPAMYKNLKEADVVDRAITRMERAEALGEASAVKQGVDAGATAATIAENSGKSEARIADDLNLASKTAQDIAKIAGASPVGAKMTSSILKQMFENKTPIDSAITRNALNSKTALSTGRLGNFSNVPAITHAIEQTIDSPAPSTLGRAIGPTNRAVEWLGARFNAAYKNADMRPIYLQEAATARSSVARRAEVWNQATKQFGRDKQLWDRATQIAQGRYAAPVGSPEAQLSKLILQNIENLIGSSGLREGAALDYTVAGRAQLLMKELNQNLKRFGIPHKFTAGEIKDATGAVKNYSEGIDWLKSWESWPISSPLNFTMRLQNAVENTVREANMFNEIASRWGTAQRAKGFTTTIAHPRLAGYYFSPEHAAQIKVFMKNLHELQQPNSKLMRQLDNVLSKWKSSVTIYMPSHHIRNFIGDTYMNWLAGVNSVRPYSLALKVMKSQKGRYDSIEDLGKLTSPKAVMQAIERAKTGEQAGEKGSNIVLTMRNGQRITNDMLYTSAFQKGLLPGARLLEDITDDATIIDRIRPLGGRGQAFFQHAAEYREHAIRLAHYIDVLKKSPKNFVNATEDAARAVRKWHPDGMDMTRFERSVMRRTFPFYSWTRKALPLMVESLVMAPGKVAAYPKFMGGLSEALTGGQGSSDPFPTDQLFPQWIRDKGIGPVMGTAGNYTIINPSNPTLDLASEFGSPLKGIGSMLNPALRIPAEELTKTEMSTGAPIDNQADYISKQLPLISTLTRLTNVGIGGPTDKFDKQGGGNATALINLLTAMGILPTGPYQKQAQFELRDYLKNGG